MIKALTFDLFGTILDLEKTYEHLETLGIPRIGYQTDYMPVFCY